MSASSTRYTRARFWKCALQVNPVGYIKYRGTEHEMTEDEYNAALLCHALENSIKVLGLADHGNVAAVDSIRDLMTRNGIVVFPGFEIATTEKAHFVCLFPENTRTDQLNRYLGALGLTDPEEHVWPSKLGGSDLLSKVDGLGGLAFAAHCTGDGGVLKRRLVHVWQDPKLRAAQIPGPVEDLKGLADDFYRKVVLNKNKQYSRASKIAALNARDVASPEDLGNSTASCLIKMTRPCFNSFKQAFLDPESRVRLNSDVTEKYYSWIDKVEITGGYLDGVSIEFAEHLNSVIGGRGTGKSTLLECIRYALELNPIGTNAQKQHNGIIKENLGRGRGRIELKVRSSRMNGRRFTISRRYGEGATVRDEEGLASAFSPADVLGDIEIYGQNEIHEIAQDCASQRALLTRFLDAGRQESEAHIGEALKQLTDNRQKLAKALGKVDQLEDEVGRLPKLEEQINQFKSLGIEDKLKVVPLLEAEKRLLKRAAEQEGQSLNRAFRTVRDNLPDTTFLSKVALETLPHAEQLRGLRRLLDGLRDGATSILDQWDQEYGAATVAIESHARLVTAGIQAEEAALEKTFKGLPSSEGKTGREIGIEFQDLLREIERIRPKKSLIETRRQLVADLQRQRWGILDDLSRARAQRSTLFAKSLKKLNKRLDGKLLLKMDSEADRRSLIDFLAQRLQGVGEKRLAWIIEAEDFSPSKLAALASKGPAALLEAGWGITTNTAEALARLSREERMLLEEVELPDVIRIELNTSREGRENYKPLDKLSTGQQCTAILHLLLLQNQAPLLMDQPEDNLDNAFIADRIVAELRLAKLSRQFIFATHNANIPIFGDAEWIGIFEAEDNHGFMLVECQGSIDLPSVRDRAAVILEGGEAAFNLRKAKYGF